MKKLCVVAVIAFITCSAAIRAAAQDTTGTISGRIIDAQGLTIPGATVTATGSQGAKTTVSDSQGRFTVPFLTPGSYTVHVELQGFNPVDRADVQVRLGQTVEIPVTLQVGTLTETVQVSGGAPAVDTTSTTIGASLDSATLSRLPVGRRFSDTLYLAPGVSTGGSVGIANPSIEGSSGLENQYVVDGVNITNGGYGALGSYSIVFGSLGNGTPYDFMQEVQVKTGGYEAEFGQATGGVINVVTKSGSNTLKGSAFGYARPSQLESDYDTVQSAEGTVNTIASKLSDVGATAGGPILRDRVFFFGAIDPQWETRTFEAPQGFPLLSLGGVDRDRRITNYAAKGTWQIGSGHRLDASFFGDPATGDLGPQRSSSLLNQTTDGYSTFLVDASVGRALNRILETPSVDEWQVTDFRATPRVVTGGLGFYEAGNRSNSWQAQAKATNILDGYGQHQIRYGFDYENLDFGQLLQVHGPDLHRAERPADGHRRRRGHPPGAGPRPDLPREPRQSHRGAPDVTALQRDLRRGRMEGRQLADDPSRPAVRAGNAVGLDREGLLAQEQLGAASRRRLGSEPCRQGEGVRELRPLLCPRAERSGRALALI